MFPGKKLFILWAFKCVMRGGRQSRCRAARTEGPAGGSKFGHRLAKECVMSRFIILPLFEFLFFRMSNENAKREVGVSPCPGCSQNKGKYLIIFLSEEKDIKGGGGAKKHIVF